MVSIIVYIIMFSLLFCGIYLLLQSITVINSAKKNMGKIYSQLHERNEKRISQLEMERRMYGTTSAKASGKESFFSKVVQRLDDVLIYSGLSIRYEWLNTSTYVVLSIMAGAVAALAGIVFVGNVILGLLIGVITVMVPYVLIVNICDRNYKQTESQLLFFVNMVANNSLTTNDIISVLDTSARFVSEPIRSAILRASSFSKLSEKKESKIDIFVSRLTREIEHPLFVRFIRNLEVCARNDADYRSVARDFGRQAENMIEAMEMQRAIFANGRNTILLLFGFGIVVSVMMCSFVEMTFLQVLQTMMQTPFGIFICVVECILYGSTAVYLFLGSRR